MIEGLVHHAVDAAADIGVRNSQPEGIGRVVALGDLVCWNNLGRNVVFADTMLRPLAIYGTTLFPDEDEPSQYDLDVHAILDVPELAQVVVLNHFGAVKGFRRADVLGHSDGTLVEPSSMRWFAADVERTVAVAGRLVSSAPRSEGAVGLLVSGVLAAVPEREMIPTTFCTSPFGEVTALGVIPSHDDPLIAVGGDGKVALLPLVGGAVGRPRWETEVGFRVATVAWHDGTLWAAGPEREGGVDDYAWEELTGGGFAAFDPAGGKTVRCGHLPDDVAWGTGGVAVAPFGPSLAAAGRTGCIHLIDPRTGECHCSTVPLAGSSLGIAHMAVIGRRILCGFNRGGHHLHSFIGSAADEEGP